MPNFDSVDPDWSQSEQGIGSDREEIESETVSEHYVSVGKSRLNKNLALEVSEPKYSGAKVSRSELEALDDDENEDFESLEAEFDTSADEFDGADMQSGSDIDSKTRINDLEEELEWDGIGQELSDSGNDQVDIPENNEYSHSDVSLQDENEQYTDSDDDDSSLKPRKEPLPASATDLEKGQHVRNQLAMWERLLDFRIRVQKLVDTCNSFPNSEEFGLQIESQSDEQRQELENATVGLCSLFDQLVDIRLVSLD